MRGSPLPAAGRQPARSSTLCGTPAGIPSGRGGRPKAGRSDPGRPGVTRRAEEPESPECSPGSLSGDHEGCSGLCSREHSFPFPAQPRSLGTRAEPQRAVHSGWAYPPRGCDRSAGWLGTDRRCRWLPGRRPSMLRVPRSGRMVGQSGLVVM